METKLFHISLGFDNKLWDIGEQWVLGGGSKTQGKVVPLFLAAMSLDKKSDFPRCKNLGSRNSRSASKEFQERGLQIWGIPDSILGEFVVFEDL